MNPAPEKVRDPKFQEGEFFDPRDVVQVKYEMLRRVSVENASVTDASDEYGVSRPTYYQAKANFDEAGIAGLVPKKRGPRGPHKIQGEVLAFLRTQLVPGEPIRARELARLIQQGVRPRCASENDRARGRWKKNAAMTPTAVGEAFDTRRPPSSPSTRRCAWPAWRGAAAGGPQRPDRSFSVEACGDGRAHWLLGSARQEPIPRHRALANPAEPSERRAVIHVFAAMAMTINDRRTP